MTPKVSKPTPPPPTPIKADASVVTAGQAEQSRYASILAAAGEDKALKRKATTQKPSLLGSA